MLFRYTKNLLELKKRKRIKLVRNINMKKNDDVEVAPGIFQSKEDFEANMAFDEMRDNKLQDEL